MYLGRIGKGNYAIMPSWKLMLSINLVSGRSITILLN
jgi:hypothetical protein